MRWILQSSWHGVYKLVITQFIVSVSSRSSNFCPCTRIMQLLDSRVMANRQSSQLAEFSVYFMVVIRPTKKSTGAQINSFSAKHIAFRIKKFFLLFSLSLNQWRNLQPTTIKKMSRHNQKQWFCDTADKNITAEAGSRWWSNDGSHEGGPQMMDDARGGGGVEAQLTKRCREGGGGSRSRNTRRSKLPT